MQTRYVKWVLILVILGFGGKWAFKQLTKPLPGEAVENLGAQHIGDIFEVQYNSNPPTSGSHFPVWAKPGTYDRVISDGHLIHSLEHGYIVLSYNCDIQNTTQGRASLVLAEEHEDVTLDDESSDEKPLSKLRVQPTGTTSWFFPKDSPEAEVELSESFDTDECRELVDDLSTLLDDYKKLIVVPNPTIEARIAVTAWARIDTMNNFDKARIKRFASIFHNSGPEQTKE